MSIPGTNPLPGEGWGWTTADGAPKALLRCGLLQHGMFLKTAKDNLGIHQNGQAGDWARKLLESQ